MEENTNTVQTEATTPTEPVTEPATPEVAESTAETATEEQTEATTPETPPEEESATPQPWSLPVRFRHENRELSHEDAVKYAQMGLQYESQQPMMDQLRMMAAARGQTVPEFINSWSEAENAALLEKKMQITNGDREAAEILVKAEMDARRQACAVQEQEQQAAEQAAQQTLHDRLAAEFVELQSYFPNVAEISQLPREVMEEAVRDNRHLYDAYLRYQHREGQKIEQNRAAQAAAAAASTGSQADKPPTADMDPDVIAARNAVRSVFN